MGIIESAQSYLGKIGYLWGGNDIEKGQGGYTDCSGFTQQVFNENGYNIGRTTRDQIKKGQEVSLDKMEKGDLIFFKNTYSGANGLSHVGIYLGDGKFIHNGGSYTGKKDGVKVATLNSYWKNHFYGARRIAPVENLPTNNVDTTRNGMKGLQQNPKQKGYGTVNPVITHETASSIDKPFTAKGISKIVVIILLMILAVVFFIMAFDIKPEIGGIKL